MIVPPSCEANPGAIRQSRSTSAYATMIAAAMLVVITVISSGYTVWDLHRQVDLEARANLSKLGLALGEETSRSIQSVDLILRQVVERIVHDGVDSASHLHVEWAGVSAHQFLVDRARNLPQIDNLILIDADGWLINHSRFWPVPPMSVADREQFLHLRIHPEAGLFVSEPVRNKIDGSWTSYLARRISDSRGDFLGVIQAAVRLRHFVEFYEAIEMGDGGAISLLRNDGVLMARYPQVEGAIGTTVASGETLQELVSGIDREGRRAPGVLDGVPRYVSLSAVRGYPLAVTVSRTEAAVLGPWQREAAILLFGAFGAVAGILVMLFALSRQFRGLRESESLLVRQNRELVDGRRYLLDAQRIGKLGHWRTDVGSRRSYWSPQLFEISGLVPSAYVRSDTAWSLVHPDDVADSRRTCSRGIAARKTVILEHRWIRPDGQLRWVHIEADPYLASNGRLAGWFGIVQDITALKLAELALEQRVVDLERVRIDLETQQRELMVATADLRVARDEAEDANRTKSKFLAMMSHEIRTPLGGILGMVGLLLESTLDKEQRYLLNLAEESGKNLLTIVNDVLDFSKLEDGRFTLESIEFDPRRLVADVIAVFEREATERGILLQSSVSDVMPSHLMGDPTRIRQILFNLVGNAIRFTERGTIHIRSHHLDAPNGGIQLRFDVTDTGIGIEPEIQKTLFLPFQQGDSSVSRKYGGTGLGLAICRQLSIAMGGTVGLSSTPGKGSNFWFTVQSAAVETVTGALDLEEQKAGNAEDVSYNILIAEDNIINQKLFYRLLTKKGHRVGISSNGKEALDAVQDRHYDLVIMDIQMPELDGVRATQAIRNLPGPECNVPIVALTANAVIGQRESYLAAGMNDCLTKPIDTVALYAAVQRWASAGSSLISRQSDQRVSTRMEELS